MSGRWRPLCSQFSEANSLVERQVGLGQVNLQQASEFRSGGSRTDDPGVWGALNVEFMGLSRG